MKDKEQELLKRIKELEEENKQLVNQKEHVLGYVMNGEQAVAGLLDMFAVMEVSDSGPSRPIYVYTGEIDESGEDKPYVLNPKRSADLCMQLYTMILQAGFGPARIKKETEDRMNLMQEKLHLQQEGIMLISTLQRIRNLSSRNPKQYYQQVILMADEAIKTIKKDDDFIIDIDDFYVESVR